MRVPNAKRAFWLVAVSFSTWGCQVVGGLPGELTLVEEPEVVLPSRAPLIWEAKEPGDEMVYALPAWLSYGCKTGGRTSQVGPGIVRTGYAANEARPRNVGMGWGLAMEPERTNLLTSSWAGDDWVIANGQMTFEMGQEDPAGGTNGVRFDSLGGQSSPIEPTPLGTVASSWLLGVNGEPPFAYLAYGHSFVGVETLGEWRRYETVRTLDDNGDWFRLDTGATAGVPTIAAPTSILAYGAQVEVGAYPSSYIPTNGSSVTRSADHLSMAMTELAPSGYFDVTIRYAPHHAMNEQQSDHDLLALEDDGVFLRMKIGGTLTLFRTGSADSVRIEGLDWAREQALEVRVEYLSKHRTISIKGATVGDGEATLDGAVPAVGEDRTVYILGDNDGPQEGADLRYVEVR